MKLALEIVPALHSALYYHALAHLELPGDDAALRQPVYLAEVAAARQLLGIAGQTPLSRAARRLARLYRRLDNPTPWQVLPLLFEGKDACKALLDYLAGKSSPSSAFDLVEDVRATRAARSLAAALRETMAAELELYFAAWWTAESERISVEAPTWRDKLREALLPLLGPLFAELAVVLHIAPALRDAGRAWRRASNASTATVIATAPPPGPGDMERVLFQVLHELTHAATDPLFTPLEPPGRTRRRAPGYAAHWRAEQAVLAADYHLLRRHRPALLPAYLDWSQRWVLPEAGPGVAARLRRLAEAAGISKSATAWSALARVATIDARRATEAAFEELLLVPADLLSPLERRLATLAHRGAALL